MRFSVIIPALDEAASIEEAIRSAGPDVEVLVADGGSSDATAGLAAGAGARVVITERGRGLQMDRAAALSTGDVLVFLHADTKLPPGWKGAVERALERDDVVGGAFRLSIDSPRPWFRVVERVAAVRARFLKHIYGDQAIFARREVFFRTGGFRNLPLMEDIDCVKRLRGAGAFVLLEEAATTSPRRWASGGLFANTVKNWFFLFLYGIGVPPDRLYSWYYR